MSDETAAELAGWARTRPIRVAFLVEAGEHGNLALDGIFADCHSRWGGRFSLIAMCAGGRIADEYWPWLLTFDPDIVYSYVDLSKTAILEIHERIVPADYVFHRCPDAPTTNPSEFRPTYRGAPPTSLSSLSTVFRLGRHSPIANGPKLKIIDSWYTERPTRFLTDNLGTYHASTSTGIFPNDARSTAGLLTVVSEENFHDRKNGVPRDLDRVGNEQLAFAEFAANRATGISLLSSLYAPRLEIDDRNWSGAFNLVVGDSFEDRLMFWNARLLVPTWLDGDLCCFRLTPDNLKDQELVRSLVQMLNSRNRVNGGVGGQPQLRIRSASQSRDTLEQALSILRDAKAWGAHGSIEPELPRCAIPSEKSLDRAVEQARATDGRLMGAKWQSFRWQPPISRPPVMVPEHLIDAPPGQSFTVGSWALDLCFECEQDKPRTTQNNVWMLPKRWRIAEAFETKFVATGSAQNLPSVSRVSRNGNLTVFAGAARNIESVAVPSMNVAINRAFCWDSGIWNIGAEDPPWPLEKVKWIRPSNEASYFTGILGMTGGLANAKQLLLHPFLKGVFASLGGAPNLADADLRTTTEALAKRALGRPVFDLKTDDDRTALAVLIVKAAQSIKTPKRYVSLNYLRESWAAHRASYWEQHPNETGESVADRKEWDVRYQLAIEERLALMRTRRLLFQGYPWICEACSHRNWTDFQALKSSLACDVCLTETDLPIDISWHFRPNEFLIESLRSHSVLSLVWVLSALRDRARASFMYLGPTCFGYSQVYENSDAEADLLVLVDGESILCEVKSSWRSLRAVHLADFVKLAKRLMPDRAILAVMEEGKKLAEEIHKADSDLHAAGIQFELLTPTTYCVEDDPFLGGI